MAGADATADRWVVPTRVAGHGGGRRRARPYVASLHPPRRGSRSRTSSGSRPAARTSITRRSAFRCAMRLACWTRSTCTRTAWTGSRGSPRRAARLARRGREEHGEIRGGGAGRAPTSKGTATVRVRAVRRARRETRPGGGGLGPPTRACGACRCGPRAFATRHARRRAASVRKVEAERVIEKSRSFRASLPRRARDTRRGAEWNDAFWLSAFRYPKLRPHPLGTYSGTRLHRRGRPCSCRWTHIRRAMVDRRVAASTSASDAPAASTATASPGPVHGHFRSLFHRRPAASRRARTLSRFCS